MYIAIIAIRGGRNVEAAKWYYGHGKLRDGIDNMKNEDILRGWKQIENYTGMTRFGIVRNGYPIRREKHGYVYAFKTDLDKFMRREDTIQSSTHINGDSTR